MVDRDYNMYDVLIGIFNGFPENVENYKNDLTEINKFFFENRENYSVLSDVAFDNDGLGPESSELWDAYNTLSVGWQAYRSIEDFSKNRISKPVMKVAFDKFSSKKFNSRELGELEKLNREFQREFC